MTKEKLKATEKAHSKLLKRHQTALQTQEDLLRGEKRLHGTTKATVQELGKQLRRQTKEAAETLRKQERVSETELQTRRAYQKLKDEQGQAVNAYLSYLQRGSIVSHPTVERLIPLHKSSGGSSSQTELPALPAIVVAAAHLPAPWSSLSFASRGVLMDSRFNSSITSSVSFDLPYVLDTLARVVKEAVASQVVPTVVLIVLLQGIAFVHLAMKLTSEEINWPTRPNTLLKALSQYLSDDLGSVLGSIRKQVDNLVFFDREVVSWLPIDLFTGLRLGSSNSALPEGVSLIHQDTPGSIFLIRSTDDEERLFIIETQSVNFKWGAMPNITMRLPQIDGLSGGIQNMLLVDDDEQMDIAGWVSRVSLG